MHWSQEIPATGFVNADSYREGGLAYVDHTRCQLSSRSHSCIPGTKLSCVLNLASWQLQDVSEWRGYSHQTPPGLWVGCLPPRHHRHWPTVMCFKGKVPISASKNRKYCLSWISCLWFFTPSLCSKQRGGVTKPSSKLKTIERMKLGWPSSYVSIITDQSSNRS